MEQTKQNLTCRALLTALSLIHSSLIAFAQQSTGVEKGRAIAHPGHLTLVPCDIAGIKGKGRCGSYEVYEDRTRRTGRKIALKIVALPATGTERATDPLVYLSGGPGATATGSAAELARAFAWIRERRDLVFVDQRGAGGSHPLNCALYNPADLQSYFGPLLPLDGVRKCRERLERDADLTRYTTSIAMDDLDEVRGALGYEQINLFGASYGTRAALVYLKRYPHRVRTVVLQGVSSTEEFVPRNFARNSERALQAILNECAADESCNKAFPNLQAETETVLNHLSQGPIEVMLPDSSEAGVRVNLSRHQAAEGIRFMLYAPGRASRVPLMLHSAAQGDFTSIARATLAYRRQVMPNVSTGLYLSITCSEDVPWIKQGEGEMLAANTFLGDSSLRQLQAACGLWPRAPIAKDYSQPTKSSAPVLILTGEWDPVTPPTNGAAVAQLLPNSLHIVVPYGAHDFGDLEGIACLERLLSEFVEIGTAKGLDTSCVKNIRRKGFALKRPDQR